MKNSPQAIAQQYAKAKVRKAGYVASGLCAAGDGRPVVPNQTKCTGCVMNAREQSLRANYGINASQYQDMVEATDGRCYICNWQWSPGRRHLDVDHDHKSGTIRGLLCWLCNQGLGKFKDSPERLRSAADYIERANGNPARV